jgi:uncharacterized membrane protein
MLWANLHLLFWLSLIPFTTGWIGENGFTTLPAAIYGLNLFLAGIAHLILQQRIIASQGEGSLLKEAIGNDWKGKLSAVLYTIAIILAFVSTALSVAIYIFVALMWVVPDKRIERVLAER